MRAAFRFRRMNDRSPFPPRSAALPGRARLEYVDQGDPEGFPVVFLHGVTDSWRSWELVLPHLPDLDPGAGPVATRGTASPSGPADYRARDFSEDIAAFGDALGLDRFVLVGHSMGATDAQRFAIDHPERVARPDPRRVGFAGLSPTTPSPKSSGARSCRGSRIRSPKRSAREGSRISTLARRVPAGVFRRGRCREPEGAGAGLARLFRGVPRGRVHVGARAHPSADPARLGRSRRVRSAEATRTRLLAAIEGSRLTVYAGAGHAVHWEEPRRFADEVAAFCESPPSDPGGER